jgi:hypothetical protein
MTGLSNASDDNKKVFGVRDLLQKRIMEIIKRENKC